jgi:hypothetical protein
MPGDTEPHREEEYCVSLLSESSPMKLSAFWDIMACILLKSTEIAEEHVSIIRVEPFTEKELSPASCLINAGF